MISTSARFLEAMTSSYVIRTRVESWLGGVLLADDIPVADATEEVDRTLRVPERLTFTVPITDRGVSYDPTLDPAHPLAPYGQQVRVSVGVDLAPGVTEWVTRGWYLIQDADVDGDTVSVTAVGLLGLVEEARFVSPFQPSSTIVATLRKLIEPALTVVVDSALTDRSVPSGITWDEDRLGAVTELLDAWPADAFVTGEGYLHVTAPADSSSSVLSLNDGATGTFVDRTLKLTRDGAATVVVARGEATDGAVVQGVAYDLTGGPLAYDGPFNPLPVPYFFSSPLLTTNAQARSAASTVLARLRRSSRQDLQVEAVPHYALQAGDRITLESERLGIESQDAIVETLTMPLTAGGGAMQASVRPV